MRRTRLTTIAATLGMGAVLAVGCATKTVAPPPVDEPPAASSPAGALQRFAWGFNHRDLDVISGLLADDFVYIAAGTDSAGNPTSDPRYRRASLIGTLVALWDTCSTASLVFDQNPIGFPDTRPGKNPGWHKQIRTSVDIKDLCDSGNPGEVTGDVLFFLTRGDSAAIPAELKARGVKPDSTRWWLDRFEDETLAAGLVSSATLPSKNISFASLLEHFHTLVAR